MRYKKNNQSTNVGFNRTNLSLGGYDVTTMYRPGLRFVHLDPTLVLDSISPLEMFIVSKWHHQKPTVFRTKRLCDAPNEISTL